MKIQVVREVKRGQGELMVVKTEVLRDLGREATIRWASNEPSGWPLHYVQTVVVTRTRVWVATDAYQAVRASCADRWHAGA